MTGKHAGHTSVRTNGGGTPLREGVFLDPAPHEEDRQAQWGQDEPAAAVMPPEGLIPNATWKIARASSESRFNGKVARNAIDGDPRTEYSSASLGTATFVEFDFGRSVRLAGFRHLDRNDPATVAASALVFLDEAGRETGRVEIAHTNQRAGVTFHTLTEPAMTRRVRWHVNQLGPQTYGTVGGAEIAFFEAGAVERLPGGLDIECRAVPLAEKTADGLRQPLRVRT